FRAQMNTLEWMPIFLPSLWLFAIYIGDGIAAAIGLVWVIGRILYVFGYARAVKDRGPGFCDPGAGGDRAVDRRVRRHHMASGASVIARRHCEERSDEAIHLSPRGGMDCFAALAMTGIAR